MKGEVFKQTIDKIKQGANLRTMTMLRLLKICNITYISKDSMTSPTTLMTP